MQGFSSKRCNAHTRIKRRWGKFKHAMIEIKYEITTDLPVGKGSKFRVFWMRHFVRSTSISMTKSSKVWHRFAKVIGKNCTLMWCPGCSRLSFGHLLIGLNFSWYISSRGTSPEVKSSNYLPGLNHDVVAFSVDVVFIVVGVQATTIEHFIQTENSSLFQGWMQSWSIQLPKCWLLEIKSAKSRLSWSRLGFIVKFIGELKLIGNYPCLHTKRR
jgi:hypothetical protein